jgi:hypothetical protein
MPTTEGSATIAASALSVHSTELNRVTYSDLEAIL